MTIAGVFFMCFSIGAVLALLVFCYHRILSEPESVDHMHAPLDIDVEENEEV